VTGAVRHILASAVTRDGNADILGLGLAVGAVLGVVTPTIVLLARTHAAAGTHRPAATAPAPSPSPDSPPGSPEHTRWRGTRRARGGRTRSPPGGAELTRGAG
jgi:hypothetical protein